MKLDCVHLDEVRQSLRRGQWPAAAPAELRDHVGGCARCGQEVLVTAHLQQARSQAVQAAQTGSASLLWWRAQARRRQEALARAARPVIAAQVFAVAVVLAAVALLAASHWNQMLEHAVAAPASIRSMVDLWGLAPLIAGAVLLSTLGAVAVYLSRERS